MCPYRKLQHSNDEYFPFLILNKILHPSFIRLHLCGTFTLQVPLNDSLLQKQHVEIVCISKGYYHSSVDSFSVENESTPLTNQNREVRIENFYTKVSIVDTLNQSLYSQSTQFISSQPQTAVSRQMREHFLWPVFTHDQMDSREKRQVVSSLHSTPDTSNLSKSTTFALHSTSCISPQTFQHLKQKQSYKVQTVTVTRLDLT